MDCDVWISSATAIIVAVIGGFFAYKGAIKGAIKQIEAERERYLAEKRERDKQAELIIKNFLYDEMFDNYMQVYKYPHLGEKLRSKEQPNGLYYNFKFNYSEYEKIKYNLLKYESKFVNDIIELYKMFKMIDGVEKVSDHSEKEYSQIRETFLKWEDIFDITLNTKK